MDHCIDLRVPLPDHNSAEIVHAAISPDPELKPKEFTRKLTVENNVLIAKFSGVTARTLRVGVNNFMDTLTVALETLDELAPRKENDLINEREALEDAEQQEQEESSLPIAPV